MIIRSLIFSSSPYVPKPLDSTRFGFHVTICPTAAIHLALDHSKESSVVDKEAVTSANAKENLSGPSQSATDVDSIIESAAANVTDNVPTEAVVSSESEARIDGGAKCVEASFERFLLQEEVRLVSTAAAVLSKLDDETASIAHELIFSVRAKNLSPSTSYKYRCSVQYLSPQLYSCYSRTPVSQNSHVLRHSI